MNISPSEPMEWVICPDCKGEYHVLRGTGLCLDCDDESREDIAKRERISRRISELFPLGSKMEREFKFEKISSHPGISIALEVCKNFGHKTDNLYLWGSTGSGKSHLAYSIARHALERGLSVEIFKPPELVRRLRGNTSEREEELLNRIANHAILLIDDFGIGRVSEAAMVWFYEIIEKRINFYRNGLIITSNLSLDDFARKTDDDRLISRLAGLCKSVKVSGKDWRLNEKVSG